MSLKTHLYFNKNKGAIIGLEDDGQNKTHLAANYAIVVMVRGLTHRYNQLLGYYFVNSSCPAKTLKEIVVKCVNELIDVKMKPRLVISDQGGNFIGLNRLLGIPLHKPFFYVENTKIYYMYDTPHLLKSFWRNFMKYDIVALGNKKATWKDVIDFYLRDKKSAFKMAPKLTDEHIFPNNFQKMRVRLASQSISSTVSAGIYTLASIGASSSTAINTAEIIEKIDKLFDVFNSSQFKAKASRRPFFARKEQIDFLNEMKSFFENITFFDSSINVTKKMRFINGWQQNIHALIDIFSDLKEEGITFLLTRNLNQDCLENTFAVLRNRGGNNKLLTPFQFTCAFKRSFAAKYMEDITQGNCEPTINLELPHIDIHIKSNEEKKDEVIYAFETESDYKTVDFGCKNAFYYFAGYILKKYRQNHKCEVELSQQPNISSIFTDFKEFDGANLTRPQQDFLDALESLEQKFITNFPNLYFCNNFEMKMFDILKNEFDYNCCKNQNKDFIIKFFIRVRVYHILKNFNATMKKSSNKHKYLSVTHM